MTEDWPPIWYPNALGTTMRELVTLEGEWTMRALFARLQEKGIPVSKQTIYRALCRLQEGGHACLYKAGRSSVWVLGRDDETTNTG